MDLIEKSRVDFMRMWLQYEANMDTYMTCRAMHIRRQKLLYYNGSG